MAITINKRNRRKIASIRIAASPFIRFGVIMVVFALAGIQSEMNMTMEVNRPFYYRIQLLSLGVKKTRRLSALCPQKHQNIKGSTFLLKLIKGSFVLSTKFYLEIIVSRLIARFHSNGDTPQLQHRFYLRDLNLSEYNGHNKGSPKNH